MAVNNSLMTTYMHYVTRNRLAGGIDLRELGYFVVEGEANAAIRMFTAEVAGIARSSPPFATVS